MHSKKERNEEGLGETPHSEVLLGLPTCCHPYNLSATSQGTLQSLGKVVFGWLACQLGPCPTDVVAWAGVEAEDTTLI